MFRNFGHTNSSVLNGGLPGWVDERLPVDISVPAEPRSASYPIPDLNEQAIRSNKQTWQPISSSHIFLLGYDQIIANSQYDPSINLQSELVLDARPKGRSVHDKK